MTIEIPTPLRVYTANQSAVAVDANTVTEAVSALLAQYPEFKKHLYTPDGKLRSFVNLYLNDEDVRYLPQREETAVQNSDTLSIIPSIAGGGKRLRRKGASVATKAGRLHLVAPKPHP